MVSTWPPTEKVGGVGMDNGEGVTLCVACLLDISGTETFVVMIRIVITDKTHFNSNWVC